MNMQTVTFNCEVITPMFLGGANQQAELRPPSIRGAMRWWFRAMMGGGLFDSSLDLVMEVRKEEAELFGDTSHMGIFSVSASHDLGGADVNRFNFRLGNPNEKYLRYLGYGLYVRDYIKPSKAFKVTLYFRTSDTSKRDLVLATFWMLANFGNLGSRASRGFGAFSAIPPSDVSIGTGFPLRQQGESAEAYLQRGLKVVTSLFGIPSSSSNSSFPPFSIVHPRWWSCCFVSPNPHLTSPIAAMNWFGEKLRGYREDTTAGPFTRPTRSGTTPPYYHSQQYPLAASFFNSPRPTLGIPLWSVFGLPHPYQFSNGNKLTILGGRQGTGPRGQRIIEKKRDRRTSPLHIRIVKATFGYSLLVQKFESQFVDTDMLFQNVNRETDFEVVTGNPNYTLVDSFIGSLGGKVISL